MHHVTMKMVKRYYCLLYIVCIGSERPSLRDLYRHVTIKAAHKWRDLGIQLLKYDPIRTSDMIAADNPHDVVSCCEHVFQRWLETSADASWNQLIIALRSPTVQLDSFADELEQMMSKECKIYSNTVATHCCKLCTIAEHINNCTAGAALF